MIRHLIRLVSLTAILFSCTPSQVENQLLDVESYIMERPDSALAVLESMDRGQLAQEDSRTIMNLSRTVGVGSRNAPRNNIFCTSARFAVSWRKQRRTTILHCALCEQYDQSQDLVNAEKSIYRKVVG